MKDQIFALCSEILEHCDASKIILYGTKFSPDGTRVREVNLCLVVKDEPEKAEALLYREIESEIVFNLLVYSEKDFIHLSGDPTSYAHSIVSKGTVLHG
jgi:hypothetical protein